jgi:hypothetical protein
MPESAVEQSHFDQLERRSGTASKLFDIRAVIGGLFVFYGVLIGLIGVFASEADIHKAQGVNINLWTGASMFVVGALFFLWLKLRPLHQ